jgi:hypothetical protein
MRSALICAAFFLLGCIAYGYGDIHTAFGGIRYTQNIIMVPPVPGAERHTAVFDATRFARPLQLLFVANHPRPDDMPDSFTFDWALISVRLGATPVMEGRVQFSGERFRARPNVPPVAVITLPDSLRGDYSVMVRPLEVGDWPDLEMFLVEASNKRFIGFALAGILWAVAIALSLVLYRRHRAAVAVWKRFVGPSDAHPMAGSRLHAPTGVA